MKFTDIRSAARIRFQAFLASLNRYIMSISIFKQRKLSYCIILTII